MLLIERAAQAGMQDVFLEVRPSNLHAIALYQSVGFVRGRAPARVLPGRRRARGCARAQARVAGKIRRMSPRHRRSGASAHLRHHFPPRRRQDHAHRKAAAVRRRDPARRHGQGPQGHAPRHLRLDAARAAARHLGDLERDAVPVPGPHGQPARHAGPRGLLRGHLPHADRGRLGADGHRLREGRRGTHDQAHGGVPPARHADHDVHQQARPRGARAHGAARRDRARAQDHAARR